MIFSVVAPNLTRLQIGVIVRQMFQRSKSFADEDCCHFVSDSCRRWISKVRRCSAAFPNSKCQPNSYTYTYGNADSNPATAQPDTYSNAHTSCHSAPAFWPAHFALTRTPGRVLSRPIFKLTAGVVLRARVELPFWEFLRSQENKKPTEANTKAGLCWSDE